MMTYKISVIIPVYNVEDYLAQCIESVVNQTLDEIEIICINDGSKDSSKEILETYQAKDKRIILVNKANGGYGAACNTGLSLARGEYISIIEPDDFIDVNMFEVLYNLAKKNNADIVKSAFYEYKDGRDGNPPYNEKINWSAQYKMPETVFKIQDFPQFLYFHPSIWSCFYKKSFLESINISFKEAKGAGWVDNPFQVQTMCMAEKIFYTDNAYYHYRLTNPTSSSNIVNIANPFDRSHEIYNFLQKNNITNPDLLAHLYKREFSYAGIVLSGVSENLLDFAAEKINEMFSRMDSKIIYENNFITEYERFVFETCRSKNGVEMLMKNLQSNTSAVPVVSME